MSGDPQRCRERALKCRYLANEARTPHSKQMFLDLAETWFRLAAELDDTNTFLHALKAMEFEDVSEDGGQPADRDGSAPCQRGLKTGLRDYA